MNISGIRISAGFYDYNSIEERQTKQAVQPLSEEEKGQSSGPAHGGTGRADACGVSEDDAGLGSGRLCEALSAGCGL